MQSRFLLVFAFLAACSGGPGQVAPPSDAAAPPSESDPETTEDAGTSEQKTPKTSCESFIACVADTAPEAAGGVVTLYGDASNCWKGSDADAEACGRACEKGLEDRPECSANPIKATLVALCEGATSEPFRMEVRLDFSPRTGGTATFKPLPIDATKYNSADVLTTLPKMMLKVAPSGGTGEIKTPFTISGGAFTPELSDEVSVARFAIERLRIKDKDTCSDLEADITSPFRDKVQGSCVYLTLADGATIPPLTTSEIYETCF